MLKGHVFDEQLFKSEIFAVFQNTFLEGSNGIIDGFGNSMQVTTSGSNLTVQSGVVCIQGRFLQEDTSTTIDAGVTQNYARLIVEIDLDKVNTEAVFNQGYYKIITNPTEFPTLTQTDIVNNVSGVYQYSLGRFQITTNGVENYVDERTYLDFTSIYGEIREKIHDIENESIFVLKEDYEEDETENAKNYFPIGGGCDYYANTLPSENFMWADGAAISRTEYAELFALIGTTYGAGNGSTTFNLPDKRSRVSVGHDAFNVITSSFTTLGATGGTVSQTLTKANLPNINGSFTMHGGSVATNINSVSGDFKTTLNNSSYRDGGTQNAGASSVGNVRLDVGSGTAHNNLQPYLVCNYIIRVK